MSTLPRIALEIGQPASPCAARSANPGLVQSGHHALHAQRAAAHLEATGRQRLERDGGGHPQLLGRMAGFGQRVRERHGVATGVRGGQQFLRAGLAARPLGTRGPAHGLRRHCAASHVERSRSFNQVAAPDDVGTSDDVRHNIPSPSRDRSDPTADCRLCRPCLPHAVRVAASQRSPVRRPVQV